MTSSSIMNPNQPGGPGIVTKEPVTAAVVTPTFVDPLPVVVTATPTTNMPSASTGTGPFYGQELPWYMRSSTAAAPAPDITVNVNASGSIYNLDDFVKIVNDAVVTANTQGLSNRRPGSLTVTE
jgi:hypothetical protein